MPVAAKPCVRRDYALRPSFFVTSGAPGKGMRRGCTEAAHSGRFLRILKKARRTEPATRIARQGNGSEDIATSVATKNRLKNAAKNAPLKKPKKRRRCAPLRFEPGRTREGAPMASRTTLLQGRQAEAHAGTRKKPPARAARLNGDGIANCCARRRRLHARLCDGS